jgi:hypothetical protein
LGKTPSTRWRGYVLTNTSIRKAKPRLKAYQMTDGLGLFLWITPADLDSCPHCYSQEIRQLMTAKGLKDTLVVPNPECTECYDRGIHKFQADSFGGGSIDIRAFKKRSATGDSLMCLSLKPESYMRPRGSCWRAV